MFVSTLVYDPLAHWVWGVGGFLRNMGALDFACGTVVHISAGIFKSVMGLRVSEGEELMGLDLSQHTESAYVLASDYDEGGSALSGHGSRATTTATSKA